MSPGDNWGAQILLQEQYRDQPWQMLVSCILLNQTTRLQVDRVIGRLFERWPDAWTMARANELDVAAVIASTGLPNVKAKRIVGLSQAWSAWEDEIQRPPTGEEILMFPGVGKYGADSYRIFALNDTSLFESGDKEIAAWAEREGVVLGG